METTSGTRRRLRNVFAQPSPAFSPVPLWWWSGDTLDPARLRWELEQFVAGGVFSLVVMNLAPAGPLYGVDADDPPFFSERWWDIFLGVCADARRLGVRLWFYDQIGFSGANIQGQVIRDHPEHVGLTLERVLASPAEARVPDDALLLQAAICPIDEHGRPSGAARVLADASDYLAAAHPSPHLVRLIYAVERGFDYLSPEACAALLDRIHGQYERRAGAYLGDVIVGSFQDELPSLPLWSREFALAFQDRHGYDPLPLLHHLWEDDGSRAGDRVRHDYHVTRAELAERAFFRPLFDWHQHRNLLCGFDQQDGARAGDPSVATRLYADYLRTHRWYGAPGSDHHGDAKIHSSLAHLYERPRVWIESFHSSGWGGTLEETFDWLLPWIRAGANLYDPHASYYSTRGGWFEWAPPSTDWRQPYWRHYAIFARAVARLCELLSEGDHVCDVGVLYPTATVQAGTGLGFSTGTATTARDIYRQLTGRMVWYDVAVGELDRLAIDYDVLDDASLCRGEVVDGALEVGAERYRVILLPACVALDAATARALAAFVAGGGRLVLVGAKPEFTLDGDTPDDAILQQIARGGELVQVDELERVLRGERFQVDADVPTLMRRAGPATLVFVPAAFPRASQVRGPWMNASIAFDPAGYAVARTVRVRWVRGRPEQWEPVSGTMRPVSAWSPWEDGVEATVTFDDGPGVILVWPGDEESGESPAAGGIDEVIVDVGDGPWTVTLVDTLRNRWGDFARPASETVPYARWSLLRRAERPYEDGLASGWAEPDAATDGWEPAVATFGPHASWTGPGEEGALRRRRGPDEEPGQWRDVEYSTSRGIPKDPLHAPASLGPSGHVPEEFMAFGAVATGQSVRFRTVMFAPVAMEATLALGAAAAKRIWCNGEELSVPPAGYLTFVPASLRAGPNVLDVTLTAEDDGPLRASLCAVRDSARFARPEWLTTADAPALDTTLRFATDLRFEGEIHLARLQVSSNLPCRVLVNAVEVGRQGGYMPYGDYSATHPYDITAALRPGANEIACELQDLGRAARLLVDGLIETGHGEMPLRSDAGWRATRDGRRVPLRLDRRPTGDPARSYLRQRPHPLPETVWLEGPGADDGTVLPLTLARAADGQVEWLRFDLAPGATSMTLPVRGQARVFVDAEEIFPTSGEPDTYALPDPVRARRTGVARVPAEPGFEGGAVLTGPISYTLRDGQMCLGDWQANGLADFSGALRYTRVVDLAPRPGQRLALDLGRVRGTAEVRVNGQAGGTRILSPYRFEITELVTPGRNTIEILVTNTLGPYLDAISPTSFVFAGQTVSGLFGPVRIVAR